MGKEDIFDFDFDSKGYGMLNPFVKFNKKSDEVVNKSNVVFRSHDHFTYHNILPEDFDRESVLPQKQMKAMIELGNKIKAKKREMERLKN